ncbi:MAG: acyltransferase, partial [Verrucomicrobiota bacterium]
MIPDQWPRRLQLLDISRGIAALVVVLWHWKHFSSLSSVEFTRSSQPFYEPLALFYEKGYLAVDYFFLLSGFVFFWLYKAPIENRQIGAGRFTLQRFSRLYPLHFVTLIGVALLQFAYVSRSGGPSFTYENNDTYHFLLNLGLVSQWGFQKGFSFNAPIWSVSVEVFLYLIFFLLARLRLGNALVCLLIFLGCYYSFFIGGLMQTFIAKASVSFFLGGLLVTLIPWIATRRSWRILAFSSSLVVWMVVLTDTYVTD